MLLAAIIIKFTGFAIADPVSFFGITFSHNFNCFLSELIAFLAKFLLKFHNFHKFAAISQDLAVHLSLQHHRVGHNLTCFYGLAEHFGQFLHILIH